MGTDLVAQCEGAMATLREDGDLLLAKSPQTYAMYCGVAGNSAFKLGRHREARKYYWMALRAWPWRWKYFPSFVLTLAPVLGHTIWPRVDLGASDMPPRT